MKITVKPGSRASAVSAAKQLDSIEARYAREMTTFLDRLKQVGMEEAERRFSGAQYDGTNDVRVSAERTDRGWRIIAAGQAVAFIEFGSGVTQDAYPADAKVQHPRGTFGQGKGADPRGWVYIGEQGTGGIPMRNYRGEEKPGVYRTKGNPPAMAMYFAVRAMRDAAPRIAREVFGQ